MGWSHQTSNKRTGPEAIYTSCLLKILESGFMFLCLRDNTEAKASTTKDCERTLLNMEREPAFCNTREQAADSRFLKEPEDVRKWCGDLNRKTCSAKQERESTGQPRHMGKGSMRI